MVKKVLNTQHLQMPQIIAVSCWNINDEKSLDVELMTRMAGVKGDYFQQQQQQRQKDKKSRTGQTDQNGYLHSADFKNDFPLFFKIKNLNKKRGENVGKQKFSTDGRGMGT